VAVAALAAVRLRCLWIRLGSRFSLATLTPRAGRAPFASLVRFHDSGSKWLIKVFVRFHDSGSDVSRYVRVRTWSWTRSWSLTRSWTWTWSLPRHFHNSVFQPRSSWITSGTTPLYRYVRCISREVRVSRKTCAHTVPRAHSYIEALTEIDDVLSEN
jgi:hypothetical protein